LPHNPARRTVDQTLFDDVQAKLTDQLNNHTTTRMKSEALLVGRIFDDRGNRMTPSHARKRGAKYRYYLSSALLEGRPDRSGSIRRIPAAEVEAIVIQSVREHLKLEEPTDEKDLVSTHIERVEVQQDQLEIKLSSTQKANRQRAKGNKALHVPWHKAESTRRREILLSGPIPPKDSCPIRSETRATLVASIARGRRWLDELNADPFANVESIAKREGCSARKVNMTISLAFLAPDLVKAAIEGRLPRSMGVVRLCDMPAEWSRQHQMLGLTSPEAR
jgi:site-specific DNA recombinase